MPRQKHRAKSRRGRGVCPAPPGPSPSAPPARACKTPAVIPLYTAGRILERRCFSIARNSADRYRALFKGLTNGADDAIARHARDANGDNKERNHPFPRRTASPNPMSAYRSRLAPCLSASSNVCLCALGGRGFSFSGNAEVHRLPSAH